MNPGEYDREMLTLLQIIWGDGYLSPGGEEEWRAYSKAATSAIVTCSISAAVWDAIDELLVTKYGARSVDRDRYRSGSGREHAEACRASRPRGPHSRMRVDRQVRCRSPQASFDVVFSKDSMVQIPDKASDFFRGAAGAAARADGSLPAIGCAAERPSYSPEMMEFFRLEGIAYNMASLEESASALARLGFRRCQHHRSARLVLHARPA